MELKQFIIENTSKEDEFLLRVIEGNNYYINGLTKKILENIDVKSFSKPKLIDEILGESFTESAKIDLESLIEEHIIPLLTKNQNKLSINKIFTIFHPNDVKFLMEKLKFLFNEKMFVFTLLILTVVNTTYFITFDGYEIQEAGYLFIPITIGVIFLSIIHEVGHSTASYAYGIMPKEVGFCFYFIFPAFYTDMNSLWQLNAKKRVIANLGGIYFQLIANLSLILLIVFGNFNTTVNYVFNSIIIASILMCLYNLNPFFKFDGYWVLSDITGIINLRKKSNEVIKNLLRFKTKLSQTEKTLLTYSILKSMFMVFMYAKISIWAGTNIHRTTKMVLGPAYSVETIDLLFFLVSMVLLYILLKTMYNFYIYTYER